jgi:hypothetical protein
VPPTAQRPTPELDGIAAAGGLLATNWFGTQKIIRASVRCRAASPQPPLHQIHSSPARLVLSTDIWAPPPRPSTAREVIPASTVPCSVDEAHPHRPQLSLPRPELLASTRSTAPRPIGSHPPASEVLRPAMYSKGNDSCFRCARFSQHRVMPWMFWSSGSRFCLATISVKIVFSMNNQEYVRLCSRVTYVDSEIRQDIDVVGQPMDLFFLRVTDMRF